MYCLSVPWPTSCPISLNRHFEPYERGGIFSLSLTHFKEVCKR